jgi:hypothetical protein
MDPKHPTDCALCPAAPGTSHVYVDPTTQARRVAAALDANARIRAAVAAVAARKAK